MAASFVCIHCGGTAFRLSAADAGRDAECIVCGKRTPIGVQEPAPPGDDSKIAKMIAPDRPG